MRLISLPLIMVPMLCAYPSKLDAINYLPPVGNYFPKDFAIFRKGAIWHVYGIYCSYNPQTYVR